jgi:transcriptional regulator with XRE-family HTH domain
LKKNPINSRLFELEKSQVGLAQELEVPVSTLSGWISGNRNPSPEKRRAIAKSLKCSQKTLWPKG